MKIKETLGSVLPHLRIIFGSAHGRFARTLILIGAALVAGPEAFWQFIFWLTSTAEQFAGLERNEELERQAAYVGIGMIVLGVLVFLFFELRKAEPPPADEATHVIPEDWTFQETVFEMCQTYAVVPEFRGFASSVLNAPMSQTTISGSSLEGQLVALRGATKRLDFPEYSVTVNASVARLEVQDGQRLPD